MIREIDDLENISTGCTADELRRIIRATAMGEYGPYIMFNNHKFKLARDRSEKNDQHIKK